MKAIQKERKQEELKRLCKAQRELESVKRGIDNIMFTDRITSSINDANLMLEHKIQDLQSDLYGCQHENHSYDVIQGRPAPTTPRRTC